MGRANAERLERYPMPQLNADDFIYGLTAVPDKVCSYSHGNESGTLWEKLWKWDEIGRAHV